jgi:hypothetical protein
MVILLERGADTWTARSAIRFEMIGQRSVPAGGRADTRPAETSTRALILEINQESSRTKSDIFQQAANLTRSLNLLTSERMAKTPAPSSLTAASGDWWWRPEIATLASTSWTSRSQVGAGSFTTDAGGLLNTPQRPPQPSEG